MRRSRASRPCCGSATSLRIAHGRPPPAAISASSLRRGAIWTRPRPFTARRWRSRGAGKQGRHGPPQRKSREFISTRGDLDAAEALFRKALEIDEALGNKKARPAQRQFGIISKTRGDLDAAEAYYRKALEIAEALGNKESGRLSTAISAASMNAGRLNAAEAFSVRPSRSMSSRRHQRRFGQHHWQSRQLYQERGDMAQACAHWRRARDIWRQIGNAGEVAKYEGRMREAGFAE